MRTFSSKKVKTANENFEDSLSCFDRKKKAFRASAQRWNAVLQGRVDALNAVSLAFVF